MKQAIIMAGGLGTRLFPSTIIGNKQLVTVYDKPLIYYSISLLICASIRDIIIITGPKDVNDFQQLLGDGSQWGIKIRLLLQDCPNGITEGIEIARKQIYTQEFVLVLGDNLLLGGTTFQSIAQAPIKGALILSYESPTPSDFGVLSRRKDGRYLIEEKPESPKSRLVIPGFYFFNQKVFDLLPTITKSQRGEFEISDLLMVFADCEELEVINLPKGQVWLDIGKPESLAQATSYLATIEARQGVKLGCPEEDALTMGYISKKNLKDLCKNMPICPYRSYLEKNL